MSKREVSRRRARRRKQQKKRKTTGMVFSYGEIRAISLTV